MSSYVALKFYTNWNLVPLLATDPPLTPLTENNQPVQNLVFRVITQTLFFFRNQ